MTVEAVLPVSSADVGRAALLAETVDRWFEGLTRLWIVADRADLPELGRQFSGIANVERVDEREVAPELRSWIHRLRARWISAPRSGYLLQQLAKLQAASWVESDFYLTLDADVLVVRPIGVDWLIRDSRARTVRMVGGRHAYWYDWSARVLDLPRSRWEHGVTPSLLSRECALGLMAHIEGRSDDPGGEPRPTGAWRRRLLRQPYWSEYTLYHTYVEAMDLFDRYHFAVDEDAWYGSNVWAADELAEWEPDELFSADHPHGFSVIQTTAADSEPSVRARIQQALTEASGSLSPPGES